MAMFAGWAKSNSIYQCVPHLLQPSEQYIVPYSTRTCVVAERKCASALETKNDLPELNGDQIDSCGLMCSRKYPEHGLKRCIAPELRRLLFGILLLHLMPFPIQDGVLKFIPPSTLEPERLPPPTLGLEA